MPKSRQSRGQPGLRRAQMTGEADIGAAQGGSIAAEQSCDENA